MFFKSMEIYGFKSFPDKTILNFDTKMTAVVGSNGNGKSNLSDALRWVMGEQGAKSLRGDKMEDVIFHGTLRRKPMGFAKVALTIDNRDRALKIDSDEITVARKLYRSGESEYLINGAKVLLKNIHELFMGTGLGRDGYSVIGQGRVSEIVDAAGAKRRVIFEEAAGVSKFLEQKKDAEHKLARTEDNLLRLRDIASELEGRIPVLEKQAAKAKKAKELLEKEEKLDITVSIFELGELEKNAAETENKILLNRAQCENFDRDIERLEVEEEQKNERRLTLRAELEALQSEGADARDRLADIRSEIAVLGNDILHANERIKEANAQIEDRKKGVKKLEDEKNELSSKGEEKKKALIKIDRDKSLLEEKLSGISNENNTLGKEYEELDKALGQRYLERTRVQLSIEQFEQDVLNIRKRGEELKTNAEGATVKYQEQRELLKGIGKELEEAENEKQEAQNKLVGYRQLFKSRTAKLDEAKRQVEISRREYETKQSRYEVLDGIDKSMAGFASSIKYVMTAAKKGALSGVCGTVADIITVESKYTVAIEIALGAVLQNIVVNDENSAKRSMRYLKDNNAGRATFLPLTSVKGKELEVDGLSDEDGFLGMACNLVAYENTYDGIIKNILGRTAVVEDIDTASYIAKKYGYKFRIVTLDGQVVNAGGSFTGGSVRNDAGIISRKQELTDISAQLVKIKKQLAEQEEALKPLMEESAKMSLEMEGFEETLAECEPKIARLEAQKDGIRTLMSQLRDIIEDNGDAVDRIDEEISAVVKQKETAEKELSGIISDIQKQEKELEKFKDRIEKADNSRSAVAEEISKLSLERVNIERDIEALSDRTTAIDDTLKEIENGGSEQLKKIEQLKEEITALNEKITEKEAESKQINASFGQNEALIAKNISESNEIESRISIINKDIREYSEEREKFSAELARQEERKAASEAQTDKIIANLWDKYEMTRSEAKERAEKDIDIVSAKAELMTVKHSISALGNVNYSSIEELDEVSTRYGELSKQLTDVETSKRELEKLISDLTSDIRKMFTESFNDISGHFGRLFSEIFDGGEARLELSDPDDVLNSDVEIYAAPPGKVVKSLTSLSGGEKSMVALTIYLAILLHRPTPFCMLDEVDAALDEANVQKYATYLKRFSNRTQLMVITHRRGTIELCDVLYGVYMQEKGVSGLLRQEITDDLDIELE